MEALQIPKNIDSKNIFLLIQELLSMQKTNNKKHGKVLVLTIVDRLNMQYQKNLDEWADKSDELKAKLAEEYHELKESLNSTGGWLLGGLSIAGAVIGLVLGGPSGALLGAAIGAGHGGGGLLGDHLSSSKSKLFFESKEEIDQLKLKEKELSIIPISDEVQAIQVKANMKQGEISRTMQIEMETVQQLETAASNMIVSLLKLFGRTADMMGRG